MSNQQKWMLFLCSSLLPIIPMMYLYNQNEQYLSFPQITVTILILVVIVAIFFGLCRIAFHSELSAFVGSLVFVILLFAYNNIYNLLYPYGYSHLNLLPIIPILSFIIAYVLNKLFGQIKFNKLPFIITVIVTVMLITNLHPLLYHSAVTVKNQSLFSYKTSFIVDDQLKSPNIYWVLCDGMLGFEAMNTYFNDPQTELITALTERGFSINKEAMLESGHWTRIAIPVLMCPDFYDNYLKDILSDHEVAVQLHGATNTEWYYARVNNETINAFAAKGYNTVTLSYKDEFFFPTSNYFYYVANHFNTPDEDLSTLPYFVKKTESGLDTYYRSKLYANNLKEIFLGGIPGIIYDKLYNKEIIKQKLATSNANTSDILFGSNSGIKYYSPLINSLYDSLHSVDSNTSQFTVVHDLMTHRPFSFKENGDQVTKDISDDIWSYPGHHRYSAKVLVNLVDMILEADPDAVIVLQADHGLHEQTKEEITKAFGDSDAAIDIWNNVFSGIRIPEKYQDSDMRFTMTDPRNISRYLVNSYVGKNYAYIFDQ